MERVVFAIDGLTVEEPWLIGPVVVESVDAAAERLAKAADDPEVAGHVRRQFESVTAVAHLEVEDRLAGLDQAKAAVDVLRLFQHHTYWTVEMTQFAVHGDERHMPTRFLALADGSTLASYGVLGKLFPGFTFSTGQAAVFDASPFSRVAAAIGDSSAPEGPRRALLGLRYLSRALGESEPDLAMVAATTALEAMLIPDTRGPKTFGLARSAVFFSCGDAEDIPCGRGRDVCPYLKLDPQKHSTALKRLRNVGTEPPWLCSEWHRVVDWYELRSAVVHGRGPHVDYERVRQSLWWIIKQQLNPIMEWLLDHPEDPIGELTNALGDLPPMPDWEALLGPLPSGM